MTVVARDSRKMDDRARANKLVDIRSDTNANANANGCKILMGMCKKMREKIKLTTNESVESNALAAIFASITLVKDDGVLNRELKVP